MLPSIQRIGTAILALPLELFRPSTWSFVRTGGWRHLRNFHIPHGFVYMRLPYDYIGIGIHRTFPRLTPEGKQQLANTYHGKVLTDELARSLIALDQEIPLRDLEQVIPYPVARELVLSGPPDVVVFECPCRHARANPCQPTQVCMIVGQPFTDFILEHHGSRARRIDQEEAVALLQAEHERGHVHIAWFKTAMLDRFYAICNCCGCCCGGIEAMVSYGIPMITSSGYVAQADADLCVACGTCEDVCPFQAIHVNGASAVDWERCMGCGVCVDRCPQQAMALLRDERKGIPLDVRILAESA
jgi:ferredoxin